MSREHIGSTESAGKDVESGQLEYEDKSPGDEKWLKKLGLFLMIKENRISWHYNTDYCFNG